MRVYEVSEQDSHDPPTKRPAVLNISWLPPASRAVDESPHGLAGLGPPIPIYSSYPYTSTPEINLKNATLTLILLSQPTDHADVKNTEPSNDHPTTAIPQRIRVCYPVYDDPAVTHSTIRGTISPLIDAVATTALVPKASTPVPDPMPPLVPMPAGGPSGARMPSPSPGPISLADDKPTKPRPATPPPSASGPMVSSTDREKTSPSSLDQRHRRRPGPMGSSTLLEYHQIRPSRSLQASAIEPYMVREGA